MGKITTDDFIATYNDDQEAKDAVFASVIEFFKKHETFSGESIMQSDGPLLDAPEYLSSLADDILGFEVEWK